MTRLLFLLVLCLPGVVAGQAVKDLTDYYNDLYIARHSPRALAMLAQDAVDQPEAFIVSILQPGTIITIDGSRHRIPRLRYNAALRLLEVHDSTGAQAYAPGSLLGFELGRGPDVRRFQTYRVSGSFNGLDFVETLTPSGKTPLVLALQHYFINEPAEIDPILQVQKKPARRIIAETIVAGRGTSAKETLRVLTLKEGSVNKLFGNRAADVRRYATAQKLRYDDLADVLRLVVHYNQLVTE